MNTQDRRPPQSKKARGSYHGTARIFSITILREHANRNVFINSPGFDTRRNL